MTPNQFPYMNPDLSIEERVTDLLQRLSVDEKIKLLAGNRFYQTHSIKRLGIKPFKMTDGPYGVARHSSLFRKNTKFPGGKSLAATWNRKLAFQFGKAAGEETRATGRHALLAPGINIDRSPLNGRTFEYFSPDPYLTKELTIPMVRGIQTNRIAACIKHYVANNQETNRHLISVEIEERALHEIYLRSFRQVIQEANPWMLMTSYNKVNGHYLHANKALLRELVFDEWSWPGFVVTDWFAFKNSNPQPSIKECIQAGVSLEMPRTHIYRPQVLQDAITENKVSIEDLDNLITRLLRAMFLVGNFDKRKHLPKAQRNTQQHQELARIIAEESMVLLKNENQILPLDISKIKEIALLGPNLNKKFGKLLYGMSSAVVPPYEITPFQGIKDFCRGKVKITNDPSKGEYALFFAGLNHDSEGSFIRPTKDPIEREKLHGNDAEGTDRIQLELPDDQIALINETAKTNPNTIVILLNGSPIAMDGWLENVPVVLEVWYPGMEGGKAIARTLFGENNPSGKLPITFPKKLSDSPAHKSKRNFPGENLKVYYDEGIFVDYRYFDQENIKPLFEFGYGLSYTKFDYSKLQLENNINGNKKFSISLDVTNVGDRNGAEIVQVYSHEVESSVLRPPKELVGFMKVFLKSKGTQTIHIPLKPEDFAFYDINSHKWIVEDGKYELMVGKSSRDVQLRKEFIYQR